MVVEVESNPNCEAGLYARFKESSPARRVEKVKTFERRPEGEWCWVTGWTDDPDKPRCAASAQLVEDSGAGLTYVVFGGLWGIRLKPVSLEEDWSLESRRQWGEPYLAVADQRDLHYAEEAGG
jgi:hypothetical protein